MASIKQDKLKFKVGASFFALTFLMLITKNAFFFGNYILAVVLHEFAHEFAARRLCYKTKEIYLSAFGAVLYGEFEGVRLDDEIKIALAGPLLNLALAVFTLALWWLFPQCYTFTQPFYLANMCIFAVNLLPCYPLDGGRVLFGLLNKKYGLAKSKKIFRTTGIVFSFIFFLLFAATCIFVSVNLTFGLFAIFLFMGATDMTKQNVYQKAVGLNLNAKKLGKGMEVKTFALSCESTVANLIRLKNNHYLVNVEVVDANMTLISAFGYDEVEDILLNYPLDTKLKDIG